MSICAYSRILSKRWVRWFMKDFANSKRAILFVSVKKGLTALECCLSHPSFPILYNVVVGIVVAFDNNRIVLRWDKGAFSMRLLTFSSEYLGFRPEFPFFVLKSTRMLRSRTEALAALQISLIWVLLNGKSSVAAAIVPLFKWPFLWHCPKKITRACQTLFVGLHLFNLEFFIAAVVE